MGKIVKYCNACEEGFAEKFAFCPNCAEQLQAFEMVSPIGSTYIPQNQNRVEEAQAAVVEPTTAELPAFPFDANDYKTEAPSVSAVAAAPSVEEKFVSDVSESAPASFDAPQIVVEEPEFVKEKPETFAVPAAAAATAGNNGGNYYYSNPNTSYKSGDGFHITVIEEKNAKQRNLLLLGSMCLMAAVLFGGFIYSLFSKDFLVGSIDQVDVIASLAAVEPVPIDEVPPPKNDDEDGGGGGGGGREEQTPVQQGRLADQTRERILIAPDKNMTQVTNPELAIKAQTEGDNKRQITNEPYGLPNAKGINSSGMGSGGGMGGGNGRGMGDGNGTGEGLGNGSGSGGGNGDGNGNNRGDGSGTFKPPPPIPTKPKVPAVTIARKIISKPRADYTDAARQNQVQGTVRVRVTFLASGQIGSVSAVNSLPYGLTEKALAAARAIRFEPAKKDGVPYTTQATIEYSFTIY